MVQYCSVSGCSSRSKRDLVAFFRFPTVRKRFGLDLQEMIRLRREKWVNCIPRFQNATEDKFKHARVCANHFISGKPAALQDIDDPDWVPSLNLRLEPRRLRLKQLATEAKTAPPSGQTVLGCGPRGFGSDTEYSDEYNPLPPPDFLNIKLDIPDDDDYAGSESDCDIPNRRLLEPEVKIEVLEEQDTTFDYHESDAKVEIVKREQTFDFHEPDVNIEIVKHEPIFNCHGPDVNIEIVKHEPIFGSHRPDVNTAIVKHEPIFDCHGPDINIEIVKHEPIFDCHRPEVNIEIVKLEPTFDCHGSEGNINVPFEGSRSESPKLGENSKEKPNTKGESNERSQNERISVISQNINRPHKFGCPLCKTTFELQDDLSKHVKNHRTSTCGICAIDLQTSAQLQEHWIQWHSLNFIGRVNEYPCGFCGKTFGDAASLREHSIAHAGPREFKCSSCDAEFSKAEELLRHRNIHIKEGYRCKECDNAFFSRGRLDNHMRNAHKNAGCRFVCDRCGKDYGSKVTLKRHLAQHIDERDLYRCCKCSESFSDKDSLESHQMSSHPSGSKFMCERCNMGFPNSRSLTRHVACHSEQGQFRCSKCPKSFLARCRLNQHMELHTGSRPYPCHLCRRSFTHESHLRQHARAHSIRAAAANRTQQPSVN